MPAPPAPPDPHDHPIPAGTLLDLDPRARFVAEELVAGGQPWRLLRLPAASRAALERWRDGRPVAPDEGALARVLLERGLVHPRGAGPHPLDDVDVVVPTRGASASLGRLLVALGGLAVTVVLDASYDPEVAAACAATGAALVTLERHGGPSAARNAGIAATERRFVAFIDDDVMLDDPADALGRLRGALEDPRLGAVAPRVVGPLGRGPRAGYEHRHGALDQGGSPALVDPRGPVSFVPSACVLVRRDALGRGFDPALATGEDVDFVWRVLDAGWLVRYLPSVVVTHPARPTWRAWWRQRRVYGLTSAPLAERHAERLAPIRADRWTLAVWGGVLAGSPSLAASVLARALDRARREPLAGLDHPERVALAVVGGNVARAAGPLARAAVRTYGIGLLGAALHPRLRRRALAVLALGLAWRLRGRRVRPLDVPLALLDDLAYGLGVLEGAWRHRSLQALVPRATASPPWVEVLGLTPGPSEYP
ncbi:MAG: mycofactocin biosynthesis glycosyltransferase MftF [Acidimicrobiales bacterium]